MRVFRRVAGYTLTTILATGQKTFDGIEQYLETVNIYPTGSHWVDSFPLPTLLIHQFERSEQEGEVQLKQLTIKRMLQ